MGYTLLAAACILFCGCISVVSHSAETTTESCNYKFDDVIIGQIVPGTTTRDWVIENLGAPESSTRLDESQEILKYVCRSKTRRDFSLLFILNSHSTVENVANLHIDLKDGIVQRYWKD
jgi:hypothetical protein